MEVLAKLQPKSQEFERIIPSFERLSQSDISHAISFVRSKPARLLGRVLYADQQVFKHELIHELQIALKRIAKRERWKKVGIVTRISRLAIVLYQGRRCNQCLGAGERFWGNRKIRCPGCGGSGWGAFRSYEIAEQLGITEKAYDQTWAKRMGVAMAYLRDWHESLAVGLIRALKK